MRSKQLLKIGVKFCGGCHAAYDRMEAFSRIKEALKGEAEFYTIAMAVMAGVEIYNISPDADLPFLYIIINGMSGLIFIGASVLLLTGESRKFFNER